MRLVPFSAPVWESFCRLLPEGERPSPPKAGIFVADQRGVLAGVLMAPAGPHTVFYLLSFRGGSSAVELDEAATLIAKNARAALMQNGTIGLWIAPPDGAGPALVAAGASPQALPLLVMSPYAPVQRQPAKPEPRVEEPPQEDESDEAEEEPKADAPPARKRAISVEDGAPKPKRVRAPKKKSFRRHLV